MIKKYYHKRGRNIQMQIAPGRISEKTNQAEHQVPGNKELTRNEG